MAGGACYPEGCKRHLSYLEPKWLRCVRCLATAGLDFTRNVPLRARAEQKLTWAHRWREPPVAHHAAQARSSELGDVLPEADRVPPRFDPPMMAHSDVGEATLLAVAPYCQPWRPAAKIKTLEAADAPFLQGRPAAAWV